MKGHMELLQNSVYAQAKKSILRVTPHIRQFIKEALFNLSLTTKQIRMSLKCDEEKAKLILAEIKRERKQKGIVKVTEAAGYLYLIENEIYPGWIKCGMTTDLESRLGSYNQYDPQKRFVVIASKAVYDRRLSEAVLIKQLSKLATISNGEWMRIDKDAAIIAFDM